MALCQLVSLAWCHRDLGETGLVDVGVVVAAAGILVGGSAVGLSWARGAVENMTAASIFVAVAECAVEDHSLSLGRRTLLHSEPATARRALLMEMSVRYCKDRTLRLYEPGLPLLLPVDQPPIAESKSTVYLDYDERKANLRLFLQGV